MQYGAPGGDRCQGCAGQRPRGGARPKTRAIGLPRKLATTASWVRPVTSPVKVARAVFSACGLYRYFLAWPTGIDNERAGLGCFANPSKATAEKTDPTVDRWIAYCRRWNLGWAWVVNTRAWRETDPKKVPRGESAIGPDNAYWIDRSARDAEIVVCGWGKLGGEQGLATLQIIRMADKVPHALKLNGDGTPAHPLYLRGDLVPFPMDRAPRSATRKGQRVMDFGALVDASDRLPTQSPNGLEIQDHPSVRDAGAPS
jgi:hypothetical protein